MPSVLFVCLGNICRSPTLEAVCRHMALERNLKLNIDSCGIGWAHLGERPDPRTFEAAKKRNILIDHKAQQFQEDFFTTYDLILAVDEDIVNQLVSRSPQHKDKIRLVTDFSKNYQGKPIPDPYYLGEKGFDQVLDISIDCCDGILKYLFE